MKKLLAVSLLSYLLVLSATIAQARPIQVQVYDSGMYTLQENLKKQHVNLEYLGKEYHSELNGETWIYRSGKCYLYFLINGAGYVSEFVIKYQWNGHLYLGNYDEYAGSFEGPRGLMEQILGIMGVDRNGCNEIWEKRNAPNAHTYYVANLKRHFTLRQAWPGREIFFLCAAFVDG